MTALVCGVLIIVMVAWLFIRVQASGSDRRENKTMKNGLEVSRLMARKHEEIEEEMELEQYSDGVDSHPDLDAITNSLRESADNFNRSPKS